MTRLYRPWSFGLLGLTLLAASLISATWVAHTSHAGDGASETAPHTPQTRGEISVSIGFADVEGGISSLYPTQSGRIVEVLVKEDEVVKAGDPLLRLDSRGPAFLVQQAEAAVKATQAQLEDARRAPALHKHKVTQQTKAIIGMEHKLKAAKLGLERKKELLEGGQTKKSEVDAASEEIKALEALIDVEKDKLQELQLIDPQIGISRAEADVAGKQAQLDQAKLALDECVMRAPVDGKVLRLFAHVGEVLGGAAKQPVIQFCPNAPRIIRAEVEQEFASRVAVGQTALVHDDSVRGQVLKGRVISMSDWYTHRRSIILEPLQVNDVRTLECIIRLDDGQPQPKIGQKMRVSFSKE